MMELRKLNDDVLKPDVKITYMPGTHTVEYAWAHYAFVTASGWLRVTWTDGRTTMLSPATVREVSGKGVEYA